MKLLTQPNKWSCLPTAFAMASGLSLEEILDSIGHDGSRIVFPDLKEPYCRQGFHIQEMILPCLMHNISIVPLEVNPSVTAGDVAHVYRLSTQELVITHYLKMHKGVLVGTCFTGTPHAVAWDRNNVFDPNGTTYPIDKFNVEVFYLKINFNLTD